MSLIPLLIGKSQPGRAYFAGGAVPRAALALFLLLFAHSAYSWTLSDLNPWKQVREYRIFSLTRANPIGVRVMVVPVIDDPVNAQIVSRLSGEFTNSLRSFATEVWLLTDLPDNPIKNGFYGIIPTILADYRLKNQLSMDTLKVMLPDFQCDYIALFEVTDYDRYWVDENLEHRVGVRAVFYDYETGSPKIEKYFEGGRGRRLEEGAFSEAERIAVKGLVGAIEKPFRKSIKERELELERRYAEVEMLAGLVGQKKLAIHQYDLSLMQAEIRKNQELANKAKTELDRKNQEVEFLKQRVEQCEIEAEEKSGKPKTYSSRSPCAEIPSQSTPMQMMPSTYFPAPNSAPAPRLPVSAAPYGRTVVNWDNVPAVPQPQEPPITLTTPGSSASTRPVTDDPWAPIEVDTVPPR